MSKESINRDRWRQLGQSTYKGWCVGCGLHHAATGEHRADCLTRPPPCPVCLYYPAVNNGAHRPDCTNQLARLEAST